MQPVVIIEARDKKKRLGWHVRTPFGNANDYLHHSRRDAERHRELLLTYVYERR